MLGRTGLLFGTAAANALQLLAQSQFEWFIVILLKAQSPYEVEPFNVYFNFRVVWTMDKFCKLTCLGVFTYSLTQNLETLECNSTHKNLVMLHKSCIIEQVYHTIIFTDQDKFSFGKIQHYH